MLETNGRVDSCSKADSPSALTITGQEGGSYMQKQHSQLWQSSWNRSTVVWPASCWLFWVWLIFGSRVGWFQFPWDQFLELWQFMGTWWLSGKESTCQCRRCWLDPWVGKIPWRRKRQPSPALLPRKSHEQRSLVGYMESQKSPKLLSD